MNNFDVFEQNNFFGLVEQPIKVPIQRLVDDQLADMAWEDTFEFFHFYGEKNTFYFQRYINRFERISITKTYDYDPHDRLHKKVFFHFKLEVNYGFHPMVIYGIISCEDNSVVLTLDRKKSIRLVLDKQSEYNNINCIEFLKKIYYEQNISEEHLINLLKKQIVLTRGI